jgi:UMF1 family MFS transporter
MVMMPEWYGISDSSLPARISFISVGIWWIGFATFITFPVIFFTRNRTDYIFKGLRELKVVLNNLKYLKV